PFTFMYSFVIVPFLLPPFLYLNGFSTDSSSTPSAPFIKLNTVFLTPFFFCHPVCEQWFKRMALLYDFIYISKYSIFSLKQGSLRGVVTLNRLASHEGWRTKLRCGNFREGDDAHGHSRRFNADDFIRHVHCFY